MPTSTRLDHDDESSSTTPHFDRDRPLAGVYYSRDGTYLRLKTGQRTIEEPNGKIHRFDASGRVTRIEDPFGNYLAMTYNGLTWTLSDTHGRRHTITFVNRWRGDEMVPHVDAVKLQTIGSGQTTWSFFYADTPVEYAEPHEPWSVNQTTEFVRLNLLTQINRPDGSSWSIPLADYHRTQDDGGGPYAPGAIKRLRLPTLGYLAWEWGSYGFPTGVDNKPTRPPAPKFISASLGVHKRKLLSPGGALLGEWNYTQAVTQPPGFPDTVPIEITNDVVDPRGTRTRGGGASLVGHRLLPQPAGQEGTLIGGDEGQDLQLAKLRAGRLAAERP